MHLRRWAGCLALLIGALSPGWTRTGLGAGLDGTARSRVVVVEDAEATEVFQPRSGHMRTMIERGLTNLTQKPTIAAAWRSLVTTQDVVGVKVYSAPGPV